MVISLLNFAFHSNFRKTVVIDEKNMHLLILDGHNSHVTLKIVKLTMNFGLGIISLSSHISHALQPLDVSYFKPFKSAFRQIKDFWTLLNKRKNVKKTTICEWISQASERSFTPNNIKSCFKNIEI